MWKPYQITTDPCVHGSREGESENECSLKYWLFHSNTPKKPTGRTIWLVKFVLSFLSLCVFHCKFMSASCVCCSQQGLDAGGCFCHLVLYPFLCYWIKTNSPAVRSQKTFDYNSARCINSPLRKCTNGTRCYRFLVTFMYCKVEARLSVTSVFYSLNPRPMSSLRNPSWRLWGRTTWSWSRTSSRSSTHSQTGARPPMSWSASWRSRTSRSCISQPTIALINSHSG